MSMLKVEDINVYYGAIHAIKGISLNVEKESITTLIGSNGAGKSTTLHTISGLLKPVKSYLKIAISRALPLIKSWEWVCVRCRKGVMCSQT